MRPSIVKKDESYIRSPHTKTMPGRDWDWWLFGLNKIGTAHNPHAGRKENFESNALPFSKSGFICGDYQGQEDSDNYEVSLEQNLLEINSHLIPACSHIQRHALGHERKIRWTGFQLTAWSTVPFRSSKRLQEIEGFYVTWMFITKFLMVPILRATYYSISLRYCSVLCNDREMGGFTRTVSGQRLGKHFPAATYTIAAIEELCFLYGPCPNIIRKR
jgi:hypothetical protein